MASLNCHITSGFSGLPKFRQLVAAMGRAPEHATLRAASATACIAPTSRIQLAPAAVAIGGQRRGRVLVPLMRTTAASPAPGTAQRIGAHHRVVLLGDPAFRSDRRGSEQAS